MRDYVDELREPLYRRDRAPRRDLVDPPIAPARTDQLLPDDDEHDVSVHLDPDGMIARVTIAHHEIEAPASDQ